MRIPINCEHCGELIAMFDTNEDVSAEWAEAPCGEKVCEACCEDCARNHYPYHACMFRSEEDESSPLDDDYIPEEYRDEEW